MAILKHISVKNRFYSSAVEYLTCQFDEYTNKPVLDEKGRIQERENYLIVGVNCDVDSFGAECIEVNRLYGKNNSVKDVKAHHYIISFEPDDPITIEQALEFGKQWLSVVGTGASGSGGSSSGWSQWQAEYARSHGYQFCQKVCRKAEQVA